MHPYLERKTKHIIIIIFLLLFCNSLFAQNRDSLRHAITNKGLHDTARVDIYNKLAAAYQDINSDSMLWAAREALSLSRAAKYPFGEGQGNKLIGLAYFRLNDFEKAIAHYKEAQQLFAQAGSRSGQSSALLSIGDVYYRMGKYSTAIDYYEKGIEMGEHVKNKKGVGLGLISIGGIHSDMGNYPEALKYYLKALSVFEKASETQGISMTLTNIATVYSKMGDHDKAKEYMNRSMAFEESSNNKEGLLLNIVNAGIVYGEMKDFKTALALFERAWRIADTIGEESWKNVCLSDIAECQFYLGRYDSSLDAYTRVLKQAVAANDVPSILAAHAGIGRIDIKKNRTAEGTAHLKMAFELAEKADLKESAMGIAKELSDIYKTTRQPAQALEFQTIYYNYKDSLYSDKNDKRVQQLQFDYELEKKERQAEKQKAIEASKREKQNVIMLALVSGLVLLLIILILLYSSRRRDQRTKRELLEQKEEIQLQAAKLEELNRFKDKIFSVLSHDLRGPVNAFTATVDMLNSDQISGAEFKALQPEMSKQLNALNLLLDNVLTWANSHMMGNIPTRPGKTSIYHLAQQNMGLLQEAADRKQITLRNNISSGTYATCDSGQIDIVLRNLMTNALKYTRPNGSIMLSARNEGDMVHISITDTGVGMAQQQVDKLFTATQGGSTYGTEGEKGIGLGLLLCYEFVKANNGHIAVTSKPGIGSAFTVILPQ